MRNYEVDLFRQVVRTEHARISVDAGSPEEARRLALEQSMNGNIEWAERVVDMPNILMPEVGQIEAIVDLEEKLED